MDEEACQANYIAGTPYVGMNVTMYPGSRRKSRCVHRVGSRRGKAAMEIRRGFSGLERSRRDGWRPRLYGTMDGWFKAVDARNGQLLWQFKTGSGSSASRSATVGPTDTNTSRSCRGVGGWAGAIVSGGLDPRDPIQRPRLRCHHDRPAKTQPLQEERSIFRASSLAPHWLLLPCRLAAATERCISPAATVRLPVRA